MHELTLVLGILAAVLHGAAYVLYIIQTKQGQSKPNVVSWSIWAFLATLNAFLFREVSGDTVAALQFFTGSVAAILTFSFALVMGKFSWLKPIEWTMFVLGLAAAAVWWFLRSVNSAYLIVLVAFIISFIPTFMGVWRDPSKETPRSWIIWTAACVVTTTNVILLWNDEPFALLTPIVLIFAHGSIAVLSRKKRKERFKQKQRK